MAEDTDQLGRVLSEGEARKAHFEEMMAKPDEQRRKLTEEELSTAEELVDMARLLLHFGKTEPPEGHKVVRVMLQTLSGNDEFNGVVNPKSPKFYVSVRDSNTIPTVDRSNDLVLECIKTDSNTEVLEEDSWHLPGLKSYVRDGDGKYVDDLKDESTDWDMIRELIPAIRRNFRTFQDKMCIDADTFRHIEAKPRPVG